VGVASNDRSTAVNRTFVLLGGALAVSAGNAWLLTRDRDMRASSLPPSGAQTPDVEVVHPSAEILRRAPAVTCEARLAATRARIMHLAKEVEHHRKLEDRYAGPPRSRMTERVIGDELARVWSGSPPWMKWQLECHGLVCQVDIAQQSGDPAFDWMSKVQTDVAPGLTNGMGFTSVDPKTKEFLDGERMYIALAEPGDFPGDELLDRIQRAFEYGDAEEDCAKRDPTAGTLDITLTVDPVARTLAVTNSGSLAGTVSAKCLLDALDEILPSYPVPLNATAATSHFTVTMPPR
jgi:hypothetical protein